MFRKNVKAFLFMLVFFMVGTAFSALADTPSITLNRKKLTLKVGSTYTLKAQVSGTEEKIVWKGADKKIATVTQSGKVKAKKPGTVKMTEAEAFEILEKKGWTVTERSYSNGHYVKWNRSDTTNYIMLWVEHRKLVQIEYCMDLS